MDYEKFKQDMEQDVLKNLANRGSRRRPMFSTLIS